MLLLFVIFGFIVQIFFFSRVYKNRTEANKYHLDSLMSYMLCFSALGLLCIVKLTLDVYPPFILVIFLRYMVFIFLYCHIRSVLTKKKAKAPVFMYCFLGLLLVTYIFNISGFSVVKNRLLPNLGFILIDYDTVANYKDLALLYFLVSFVTIVVTLKMFFTYSRSKLFNLYANKEKSKIKYWTSTYIFLVLFNFVIVFVASRFTNGTVPLIGLVYIGGLLVESYFLSLNPVYLGYLVNNTRKTDSIF